MEVGDLVSDVRIKSGAPGQPVAQKPVDDRRMGQQDTALSSAVPEAGSITTVPFIPYQVLMSLRCGLPNRSIRNCIVCSFPPA